MLRLCGFGVVLSLVAAAAAVMAVWLMDWWGPEGPPSGLRLFVPEELARYRGGPGDPGLYLALLGRVYDVSSGRRHYEPGAHYSGFAGISEALPPLPPEQTPCIYPLVYSSAPGHSTFLRRLRRQGHGCTVLVCGSASYIPARFV